jgi:transposase InsO family protein
MIFDTDRGVEYGAHLILNELTHHGIKSSMNRQGNCTDNAHLESFFHSLKAERIHGEYFKIERESRLALNGYIQLLLVIAPWNMNKKKLRMECVNFSGGGSLIGPISRMATISIRLKFTT